MRRSDWRSALLWIGCLALTLAVMAWVTREESDHQFALEAERSATTLASALGKAVPGLDQQLARRTLTAQALASLSRWREDKGILRFEILDRDGVLVTSSDVLAAPGTPVEFGPLDLGRGPASGPAYAVWRQLALAGLAQARLERGTRAGASLVYSEVLVALPSGGAAGGLARIFSDQSQKAADAAQGITRIALVALPLLGVIGTLAAYQQIAARRRQGRSEATVRHMARHDALSGALNRASFVDLLATACAQARPHGNHLALMRIDLDNFGEVNEEHGLAVGDEVLRMTTRRLSALLRKGDQLARLEGDEFAVLWLGAADKEAITSVVRRINEAVALPCMIGSASVQCGASVGVAMGSAADLDGNDLMAMAQLALARAKTSARGGFVFHDKALDDQVQARRELARDLRLAIGADQLTANYQPLFANDGVSLVGYETLVRWHHPVRGAVSPAEFIPLAEEDGLIGDIGLWVLRRACKDAAHWPDSLTVAVNLSVDQFASGKLVQQVAAALADSGLRAGRLGLEITETMLMHNSEQVMQTLRRLGALGVSIAMDDFGTGYSSLAYLWRFPFDKLKIDQAFTRNLASDNKVALIVRSIIALAHSLDIRVNAEGVETYEQMAMLQQLGCDELQGFLLGKPAPTGSLSHAGHGAGKRTVAPRGEERESLFATLAMDLPQPGDERRW